MLVGIKRQPDFVLRLPQQTRKHRMEISARGVMAACLFGWLLLAGCRATAPQTEFKVPPGDSSRENPVRLTASSVAEGNQGYLKFDCAVCHGKNGNGKGFMAGASRFDCRDWRDSTSLKNFTDGDLFYILIKGKGSMPAYERRLNDHDAWLMVDYIRSLAKQNP